MGSDFMVMSMMKNGLRVIHTNNGINMYSEWSKWLSYLPDFQKKKYDKISNQKVSELSIDDLEYITELRKQIALSRLFEKVNNNNGTTDENILVYNYVENNSLSELMISKLTKKELEYAHKQIESFTSKSINEITEFIETELKNSKLMPDKYVRYVLEGNIINKAQIELEEEINRRINDNSYMRLKSYHNASSQP